MRVPFRNLGPQERFNLLLAAIAGFYLSQVAYCFFLSRAIFAPVGLDFMVFWSAGYVANSIGYSQVYNVDLITKIQVSFAPVLKQLKFPLPFFSLPVFVLPFQAFALLPPMPGFFLWSFLNFLTLVLYLKFFARKAATSIEFEPSKGLEKLLPVLMLSYPVFHNFFWGQNDVWLMVFFGEFMRALWENKPWRAGAWLAGLLLKPQALVLILPSLLLGRRFKVIGGFVLTFQVLLLLSWLLSGFDGIKNMLALWLKAGTRSLETGVECMINWRALGYHLSFFISPVAAQIFIGLGMALTAILTFYLWLGSSLRGGKALAIAISGTIAATLTFAWHSHFHMAMLLLPPLIYLAGVIPSSWIKIWALVPPITLFLIYLAGALAQLAGKSLPEAYGCQILLSLFILLHSSLLIWSVKQKGQSASEPIAPF